MSYWLEKAARKPVRAYLVRNIAANIVVGTDAGLGGQHGVTHACFKRLVDCQRPQWRQVFLEGLHTQAAENVVMPARVAVTNPREGHVGQKVRLGAEITAHSVRKHVFVVSVVHTEEVNADAEVAVFGHRLQAPVSPPRTIDSGILLDCIPGEILAAGPEIESRFGIAMRILHLPLVGRNTTPDLPLRAK